MRPAADVKKQLLWRESLKQFGSRVGGVSHSLICMPQGPGGIQERWQIAISHLLCRANAMLQPALVLGSGSNIPDGDGEGEDGLNDCGVEVHHHCLWQVEFPQLP